MNFVEFLGRECRHTFMRSSEQVNEFDSDPRHVAVGDFNHDGYLDIYFLLSYVSNIHSMFY